MTRAKGEDLTVVGEAVERLVVWLGGNAFNPLSIKQQRPARGVVAECGQKSVVVSGTSPQPEPLPVEGQARNEDPVDIMRSDIGAGLCGLRDGSNARDELAGKVGDVVEAS